VEPEAAFIARLVEGNGAISRAPSLTVKGFFEAMPAVHAGTAKHVQALTRGQGSMLAKEGTEQQFGGW